MKKASRITCLFVDIGGVLLTDGWGRVFRDRAVKEFGLNSEELESRHSQAADIYELGKLNLEEYLDRVIFYEKRPFSRERFRQFMFAQSRPFPEMIQLVRKIKALNEMKVVVVSNESRELNDHRIRKFKLEEFVDFFVSSCYVGIRKPDADIYRFAMDTARVPAKRVVYIENTPMFVNVAEGMGIRSVFHANIETTRVKLASLGLRHD
jgi:putative hydrolase of the HAD superfamily